VGGKIFSFDNKTGLLEIPQQLLKVQDGATYCFIRVGKRRRNSSVRFWNIRYGRGAGEADIVRKEAERC
jgi:hypothetical protein